MLLRPIAFFLLVMPAAAMAAATPRQPAGKWNVNFAEAQCLAAREYGTAENPLQLVIKAGAIGDVVQLAIVRKARGGGEPEQVNGTLAVDGGQPLKVSMLAHSPKGKDFRIHVVTLRPDQFALVRQAKQLSVGVDRVDETFAISQMPPLLKVLDECVADLRKVFNITDPATGDKSVLPTRAKVSLAALIDSDDYPGISLQRNQSGRVKFALLIGEDGRVADCMIIETSGVAALDAQSCAILKIRARFTPARDAEGKPAKDAVTAAIVWKL